jgi:hypothetical protein
MKQIKVSEATPTQLDWLVATLEGRGLGTYAGDMLKLRIAQGVRPPRYTTDWSQGGPIIDRENISLAGKDPLHGCCAAMTQFATNKQEGPTNLIAAMRCYVASELGDTVEVPEELV